MSKIEIYRIEGNQPMSLQVPKKSRDWMTENVHAYRCVPLSIANEYGWNILLPETTTLEWNGGVGNRHMKVIEGNCFESHFGSGTVTLKGSYTWRTEEDLQLMVMPVPNADQWDLVSLTAIIETDRLLYPWFLTCKLTKPGRYTFKAGMPLARIVPIRIKDVVEADITIGSEPEEAKEYRLWQTVERIEGDKKNIPWKKFYHKVSRWTKIITPNIRSKLEL